MMSMLDYIKWRGDLSFEERELNEIDSLILSYLSYEMFDGLVENKSLTIQEISKRFFAIYDEKTLESRLTLSKKSYLLLKVLEMNGEPIWFGSAIPKEKEKGFAAVKWLLESNAEDLNDLTIEVINKLHRKEQII